MNSRVLLIFQPGSSVCHLMYQSKIVNKPRTLGFVDVIRVHMRPTIPTASPSRQCVINVALRVHGNLEQRPV